MSKSSEEFNSEKVIRNIGYLCSEELEDLPYWETNQQLSEETETG